MKRNSSLYYFCFGSSDVEKRKATGLSIGPVKMFMAHRKGRSNYKRR